ncbi:hypothetical protein WA026_003157 [Henosepilachna vigintioctopunctata]|uniref:G-protein coupled receptors family 2 profile 2 domain-containing protein n=1 Tax=Henosepilachna vigintioctopunctata TaxID=420089 RepID=A0AAW1TN66_9CUCU
MRRNLFPLLLLYISQVFGYINEKCCKTDQSITVTNNTFTCKNNTYERIQSNFKKNDFFGKNSNGSCIEIYSQNKSAMFSVNVARDISKEDIKVKYFPKCCPLLQKYNKTSHSCVISDNSDFRENFLEEDSFIKVGLPQCKIISDKVFSTSQDLQEHIQEEISENVFGNYCVDSTIQGDFVIRKCEKNDQICSRVRCFHKCCPDGQSYINGSHCFDTFKYGVDLHSNKNIHVPDSPFVVIHGIQKPIFAMIGNLYNISIDKTGLFSVHMNDSHFHFPVSHNKYCMEHVKSSRLNGYILFSTASEQEVETKFIVARWAKVVSCICLLLTILVYLLVPKMRNLFGNIILSYSVATFLMFFFLAVSQFFYDSFNDSECLIIGFLNILVVIWSFTWLHIMCIEIWRSLRIPRNMLGPMKKTEVNTMVKYSLIAWILPILWVMLIALLSKSEQVHKDIRPYIGEMKCFIEGSDTREGNYAHILFVVLPLAIQQIINTLLFAGVIKYYILMERMRGTNLRGDLKAGKERLILILKLTVIMGTSFLFETVSSLFDFSSNIVTEYIEVVWDTINCLQGLFIFIVFICKRKVFNYICDVIPFLDSKKVASRSSSKTQQFSLQQIEETLGV